MKKLHIGLMLPLSTILPIGKDFEAGLNHAIKDNPTNDIEIEITKDYIGQGGTKRVLETLDKYVKFDHVDIITGVVSNRVVEELSYKIQLDKKPFIMNNAGGFIPSISGMNDYILHNSLHLWQHAWALGYWGVKNIGKRGMFVSALYDAGYSFSHMFSDGMQAADATSEWLFAIAPLPNQNGGLSDVDAIIPVIEQQQPDFIFATFCGEESTMFINAFIKAGLHKKIKLLALPYLLAPFKPVLDDITIITTNCQLNGDSILPEKCFYQLGYQTGTAIVEAAKESEEMGDLMTHLIKNKYLVSSQSFSNDQTLLHEKNGIDICEAKLLKDAEQYSITTIEKAHFLSLKDESMKTILKDVISSWQNSYLCI